MALVHLAHQHTKKGRVEDVCSQSGRFDIREHRCETWFGARLLPLQGLFPSGLACMILSCPVPGMTESLGDRPGQRSWFYGGGDWKVPRSRCRQVWWDLLRTQFLVCPHRERDLLPLPFTTAHNPMDRGACRLQSVHACVLSRFSRV